MIKKYNNILFDKFKLKKIINVYKIFINRVGIKNLYYPFIFDNGFGKLQKTIGLWNINTSLFNYVRGIHMSRIIFFLDKILINILNIRYFYKFNKFFIKNLNCENLEIQVSFIYFLKKISPISGCKSLSNYKITFLFEKINIFTKFIIKFLITSSSLCPCSKSISYLNAHNQRIHISIFLFINKKYFDLNNFIKKIEQTSSGLIWSILKRNDERFVTEFSYKNPKFIEDLIRSIYFEIKKEIFFLKIENFESIHNHDVYSYIKKI